MPLSEIQDSQESLDTLMKDAPSEEISQKGPEADEGNCRRRSDRVGKPPKTLDQEKPTPAAGLSSDRRRNPRRNAATVANSRLDHAVPEHPLEEALRPLREDEFAEYESWIELESEPAFFNIILRELGVDGIRVQELFSIDQDSLCVLPKPVHGFVFLYHFEGAEDASDRQPCPDHIWFANQTTDNACATVALLNIVMNIEDLSMGKKLQEFKQSTKALSPPLRGHRLSSNVFIRSIHNSFSRRLDLLNSDLYMSNKFEAEQKKSKASGKRTSAKKRKKASDSVYHFIAYLPIAGKVWELDGLEMQPLCLGEYDEDWTAVAQPAIQARMLQCEGEVAFNLLALCGDPLAALRAELAGNIARLECIVDHIQEHDELRLFLSGDRSWISKVDSTKLANYGLTEADVAKIDVPQSFHNKLATPSFELPQVMDLQQSLEVEQRRIAFEYNTELMSVEDEGNRVRGRKKNYTMAIHEWVKCLVERGVLQELIEDVN